MLSKFINKKIVIDTTTQFAYLGKLKKIDELSMLLIDSVIIDAMIIKITLEEYLIECAENGYCPSRKSILISRDKVISVSLLSDIIIP